MTSLWCWRSGCVSPDNGQFPPGMFAARSPSFPGGIFTLFNLLTLSIHPERVRCHLFILPLAISSPWTVSRPIQCQGYSCISPLHPLNDSLGVREPIDKSDPLIPFATPPKSILLPLHQSSAPLSPPRWKNGCFRRLCLSFVFFGPPS